MPRRVYDNENHAQFITFSCYHRRRLLDCEPVRDKLLDLFAEKLERHSAICAGYVVMPDHLHAIVWCDGPDNLSILMKSWKQTSSLLLKKILRGVAPEYASTFPATDPFWQAKYYPFNLYTLKKAEEKLNYMYQNPVRAGIVERAIDWRWSSARFFELNEPSEVPLEWIF